MKYLISKYQWGYNWKNHSLNKQKFQKKKKTQNEFHWLKKKCNYNSVLE